jgi:hypothetical protein
LFHENVLTIGGITDGAESLRYFDYIGHIGPFGSSHPVGFGGSALGVSIVASMKSP